MSLVKHRVMIRPQYADLRKFVERLPSIFEDEGEYLYNKRNAVKRFEEGEQVLVVKRYKVPLFFQRVDYTWFRPSKALRAYRFAVRLKELGIDTPEAVACVEVRRCGMFWQGYFVSKECRDHDVKCLLENPDGAPDGLFHAYVDFLLEMHAKGFLHGDLNLSNVLYRSDPTGGFHFTVIDTNRSHFVCQPTREQCLQNLMRISRNRPFSRKVVSRYAELRGWDVEESVAFVFHEIDRYERKRKVRKWTKVIKKK